MVSDRKGVESAIHAWMQRGVREEASPPTDEVKLPKSEYDALVADARYKKKFILACDFYCEILDIHEIKIKKIDMDSFQKELEKIDGKGGD